MSEETVNVNGRIFETTDLAFAGYLQMKGFRVNKIDKYSNKKYTFCFQDPEEEAESTIYEFLSSESKRFDDSVRALKNLCFTKDRNQA